MRRIFLFSLLGLLAAISVLAAEEAAENELEQSIKFPIAELGDCGSKAECRAYCDQPANQDACLAFAEKHGLIKPKEVQAARKVLAKGGPGGCRSEQTCRAYCEQDENFKECVKFGKANGLMDAEEEKRAEKLRGATGPGGCHGMACRKYCADPERREECVKFAKENNLMTGGELEKFKEEQKQFADHLRRAPPAVQTCLQGKVGEGFTDKIAGGDAGLERKLGAELKACFEQFNEKRKEEFEKFREERKEDFREFREERKEDFREFRQERHEEVKIERLEEPNADQPGPTNEFKPFERAPRLESFKRPDSFIRQVQAAILNSLLKFLR